MTRSSNPTAAWQPGVSGRNDLPSGPAGHPAPPGGDSHGPPAGAPSVTIGSYPDYPSAQRVVDYLADNRFPVERTAIVGTNLTLVETVLGRMTTGRAALVGAGTGAWFGLFIGLLFGIFATGSWVAVILVGLVVGAIWGAVFGAVAHAMSGGGRDFTSASSLRAGQYAVTVDADQAEQARQLLGRMHLTPTGATAR
ncbi:general stress protein [Micromonospora sp. RTGN7]|uniref:general stress protein n=1 Tax=Micromonospora sp. RTGN7 TaxID=3016526 RepID=UPI0029FED9EB|nr:general stress protein [Micromonospora sp. RTGN7]